LVADDNLINRRVLSVFLEKLGYHPLLAENGRQVLEVCRQQAIDVILMDVQMPELDGHQAALQLRQQLGSASRPWIIALTASAGAEDVAAARAAGMNDFLTKPLVLDTLTAALKRATQQLQQGAAASAAPLPPVG
jgi:CheY-like chemotaxis protein